MAITCVLLAHPMLKLMRTPETLYDNAYDYIVWIFAGLVVTALFNLLSNMIRALGDSKTPLYFLIVACVVNIILDVVFISALGMGTAGAGLATVVAQLVSGLLCILYLIKKHPMLHIKRQHFTPEAEMDRHLLRIGIPMAFLNMVLSVGSVIVQFVTNGFGDTYVSAQVTGSKIESFLTQPLISFGSAVSVFTAQNHGAGNFKRVLEGSKKTLLMCFIWCAIAATLLVSLGKPLIMLIAGEDVSETVIKYAYEYILINTAFTLILSMLIVYKSILQSVDKTTWPMISGFTEILGRGGVAVLVVILTSNAVVSESLGFTIVCLANPMAWLFGLLTVLADYIVTASKFKKIAKEQPSAE
jgi:Na+-driven multidrug efflux pump